MLSAMEIGWLGLGLGIWPLSGDKGQWEPLKSFLRTPCITHYPLPILKKLMVPVEAAECNF
jgi:hypothetical protein